MKRISILVLFMLFILIFTGCTQTKVSNFKLVNYGIVSAHEKGWKKTDSVNFGRIHSVVFKEIKNRTTKIPAKIGTRFGLKFVAEGKPKGEKITIQFAGTHPQLSNPKTGKTFTSFKYSSTVKIGKEKYMGYTFDHDWELKPGNWTFNILYQNKVVVKKVFNISK